MLIDTHASTQPSRSRMVPNLISWLALRVRSGEWRNATVVYSGRLFFLCETKDFWVTAAGRVNLIGEHIDYEGYSVLPMAIALVRVPDPKSERFKHAVRLCQSRFLHSYATEVLTRYGNAVYV